jgi:hypothetical protein
MGEMALGTIPQQPTKPGNNKEGLPPKKGGFWRDNANVKGTMNGRERWDGMEWESPSKAIHRLAVGKLKRRSRLSHGWQ